MAVTSVGKCSDGHEASQDERGIRTVRETMLVTVSSPIDDPQIILDAIDPITGEFVPAVGDVWSGYVSGVIDPDLKVRIRTPHQTDDILVWKVAIEYTTEARDGIFDTRLQVHEWQGQVEKRALERDINGVSIVNSAGQRYDPPIEDEETIIIRRVTRNELNFLDSKITTYQGKVNSDTITIGGVARDPYTVWMRDMKARREFAGSLEYDVVSYELHIKPLNDTPTNADQGGWYTRVADAGFQKHKRQDPQDHHSPKMFVDRLGNIAAATNGTTVWTGTPLLMHITDPISNLRLSQAAFLDGDGGELIHAITQLKDDCSAIAVTITVEETFPIVHDTGIPDDNTAQGLRPLTVPFWIKVGDEIMKVNAYNVGTPGVFQVTRGQKSTVATVHTGRRAAVPYTGDKIALQPVYLRFEAKKKVAFTPLLLP